MKITEFLEARIAEDEARAKYVSEYGDTGGLFAPTRVLAECAAKWAIMRRYDDADECRAALIHVVEALASVYANHPDYDKNWRR